MARKQTSPDPKRSYPPGYEKAIPVLLLVIVSAIVLLLAASIAVVLGVFPGMG